ncbi:unnamed protein product [Lymnaea stagnalis]|uniref:Amine oxidase n=1 Tax=Lymnaea stagnalis TaxID=6523 RepID=A0AAV2H474_LYMST
MAECEMVPADRTVQESSCLLWRPRRLAWLAVILLLICVLQLAWIVGIHIKREVKVKVCGEDKPHKSRRDDVFAEPDDPGPFHDLTTAEIKHVRSFLERTVGVVKPEAARLNDPHIYIMDLVPPVKSQVLAYLDHQAPRPLRYAKVILFRGDQDPPVVEERICGPLKNFTSCDVVNTIPFAQRPFEYREYDMFNEHLIKDIQDKFGHIIRESYGASLDYEECKEDCLNYYTFAVASRRYDPGGKRQMWILAVYDLPYMSLYPLDFAVLADVDGVNETLFSVAKVWYSGVLYSNPRDLIDAYNNGTAPRTHTTYPTKAEAQFSTFAPRGVPKPHSKKRPPVLIEPDGKRYTVQQNKVEYLDMWSFHVRMSTIFGPALYDIKFLGERIVYELSLSELAVFYSGFNPTQRQAFYVDSTVLTGSRSKALIAGADCPTSATFLPFVVSSQGQVEPAVFPQSICIFENNLGTPLRRHHSYSKDDGGFYGGLMDSALVVRSIHTVDNYDYIIDFIFHQNGALGVTVGQTGYLLTNMFAPQDKPYGVRLTELITGAVHLHVANFKVDMDINGTSNRYETLDIQEETVQLRQVSISDSPTQTEYSQTKFSYTLKTSEKRATYQHDFEKPMYHIFHNEATANKYGEKKAYRIVNNGMAKQLLKLDVGDESTQPWARYQMAVTQHKDSEQTSSSPYSQWNGDKKIVDFQSFVDDDENIVDKDLVAWVTLGVHHIPHSEDLPVTTTSGKHQSFYLYPYNYFPECPSMASRDSVRISHVDPDEPEMGLLFEGGDDSDAPGATCEYKPYDTTSVWRKDPDRVLETYYNKGVS